MNSSQQEGVNSDLGNYQGDLKIAVEIILVVLLAIIMTAMGCDTSLSTLWAYTRRPGGVIIGMISQFCILPFCAYCIGRVLKLTAYESLSLLILSCCPGGPMSNLFSMWCDGNVSLSICMTSISTLLALGVTPLNLLLYAHSWDGENIQVPYLKITITLIMILVPCLIGVTIKHKWPKAALWLKRSGSVAGFLAIIGSIIMQSFLIPGLFECGWKSYVATLLLPFLGFNFGFICANIFKLSNKDSRTVAMETGFQNVPLALTMTYLSFPFEKQKEMAPIQMVFAIFLHIEAIAACLLYHLWRKTHPKLCINEEADKMDVTEIM